MIKDNIVSTISGGSEEKTGDAFSEGGYIDGNIDVAMFANPQGIAVTSDGKIFVADTGNGSIRVIDTENSRVGTLLRSASENVYPVSPRALAIQDDRLYVGDVFARTLFSLSMGGKDFTDVDSGAWYYEAVAFVSSNALFAGISDTEFAPQGTMTRGMFVTVLSRACRIVWPGAVIRGGSTFWDVLPSQYFYNPVAWAADNGITSGTGIDTFSPNTNVTREEMALLLYNFAKFMEFDIAGDDGGKFNGFPDSDKTSTWAVDALSWAVAQGIINGTDDGMLMPKDTATRAQAAQIFLNFFKQLDW